MDAPEEETGDTPAAEVADGPAAAPEPSDAPALSVDTAPTDNADADRDEDDNDGDLLRGWSPREGEGEGVPPGSPFEYVDETPYEHNFQPGDHIIRWDMLPILWPIQIHGIVLEVSEDKSEVTICDFGVTSVKEDKKMMPQGEQGEATLEEENAKFTEAIDECEDATEDEVSELADASPAKKGAKEKKKRQRLNVIKLTKWSDLKKWKKVDYEGGLLNVGKGGMGKGLKKLGDKTEKLWASVTKSQTTEKLWTSVTKSLSRGESGLREKKKVLSVRYDVDDKGYCVHHPEIQLKRSTDDGDWAIVRKKCPECILEDCPAMMGDDSPKSRRSSVEAASSVASTENESVSKCDEEAPTDDKPEEPTKSEKNESEEQPPSETNGVGSAGHSSEPKMEANGEVVGGALDETAVREESEKAGAEKDEPKSLSQMIAEANEVEQRSRTTVKTSAASPQRSLEKKKSWSFMKSLSNIGIFPPKDERRDSANADSVSEGKQTQLSTEQNGDEKTDLYKQTKTPDELPRSDPPVLVLARTRFILQHGEEILPPYHIINSNSECIAVWCKTGRWSTLQASVFLHSTAIGHAKSATALTLGVAATQPWLIPAFATVGLAAVGTPWLFLKVANDKWQEATLSLTEKFWSQAEPEVFVECIEKWSKVGK